MSQSTSNAQTVGASVKDSQHKKKRFHGNVAAAINARRAGFGTTGQHESTALSGEGNDDEGAFISSSRDASEEDNDDASGYSDSASSLRQASAIRQHLSSPLPNSVHDRAVVDSREAHRSRNAPASADKTPLSSSPSRSSHIAPASSVQLSTAPHNLPAAGATNDAHTSAALSHATAALVDSRLADMEGSPDSPSPPTGIPAGGLYSRSSAKPLLRQESSAGSEMSDAGNARDKKLSLGALPSASSALDAGIAQLAATTPKAPVEQQLRTSSTLHSGGTSLPAIRETRKKSVSQVLDPIAGLQQEAASQVGKKRDSGTDEGSISENTTTNPYDGDVEFAAPSTHSPAPIAVAGAFASSQHTGGSPHLASRLQLAIPTAPDETPSKTFVTQAPGGNTDSDAAYSRSSKPISAPSATEIRKAIHQAIFEPSPQRTYQINPPRDGGKNPARPIRIYADGVYDLFHYAHMLQLRQAKLSFQSVYLIVGVVSSAACAAHKNEPVMTSQERYASVRNCRWVDEVVEDAPWVITQELIDRYQIDYVAHDDLPYAGAGSSASMTDIYQFAKEQGRFLPTQRTEGVSTSELLARIVEQYRNHNYDQKLTKIGHEELTFH